MFYFLQPCKHISETPRRHLRKNKNVTILNKKQMILTDRLKRRRTVQLPGALLPRRLTMWRRLGRLLVNYGTGQLIRAPIKKLG